MADVLRGRNVADGQNNDRKQGKLDANISHEESDAALKKYEKGLDVWVQDDTLVWVQATVVGTMKDGRIIVRVGPGQDSVVWVKGDYPQLCGENNFVDTEDLTRLNPLTEPAVLHCIHERYKQGEYYTTAGITLVAVNPFSTVPSLYSQAKIQLYSSALPQDIKDLPPHVFAVAQQAFGNLSRGLGSQAIIVSGESGAGKTWTARCLMRYLATTSAGKRLPGQRTPTSIVKIEKRILDSNPILEAFGNAGTVRNHNSSRFGKFIQLQFNRSCHLVGASIQTYLLEKTRVVHQAQRERNYHIFYQLYHGISDEERELLGLGGGEEEEEEEYQFEWLPTDDSQNDSDEDWSSFAITRQAMTSLGIGKCQQQEIFMLLSAILHLGNIVFNSEAHDDGCPCTIEEDSQRCQRSLRTVCSLLGVDEDALGRCLTYRRITAAPGRRKSVFMKPCKPAECLARRDCLAKLLYARLFDWIVDIINKNICGEQVEWKSFIGLLDVYGFESFPDNSLEQLCINYANEKLQQHFVHHFLRAQQEEYEEEMIPWNYCQFVDNRDCLELIEGKISVFALVNEECRLNRPSDSLQLADRIHSTLGASRHISRRKSIQGQAAFTVHHYADRVSYQLDGFVEKNKDAVPEELMELISQSGNKFVSSLVGGMAVTEDPSTKKGRTARTVVSKFKASLDKLMQTLESTSPHYIRCIKPNIQSRPGVFDRKHVESQLQACGVLETVNISRLSYPCRLAYPAFLERYGIIMRTAADQATSSRSSVSSLSSLSDENLDTENMDPQEILLRRNLAAGGTPGTPGKRRRRRTARRTAVGIEHHARQCCQAILRVVFGPNLTQQQVQYGKTKVFLGHGMFDELESARARLLSQNAFTIQCCWRRYKRRKVAMATAALTIQRYFRGWKARHYIRTLHWAARIIQRAFLQHMLRRVQDRLEEDTEDSILGLEEEMEHALSGIDLDPIVMDHEAPVTLETSHNDTVGDMADTREFEAQLRWRMEADCSGRESSLYEDSLTIREMGTYDNRFSGEREQRRWLDRTIFQREGIASIRQVLKGPIVLHVKSSVLAFSNTCPWIDTAYSLSDVLRF
ncbi:PREDICTED: unconventional myosin-XIX-like [Branchiostoma belcheri]|uniref:Unconventional myosin-XIX-like n=1 Tax=Branchiostoma belcheri TaxID=7741 RepID=A0A6P4YTV3_BRABE|nr:PREDICTED: unconventional myosin-XIX-like [Branchiostoma belcheri]